MSETFQTVCVKDDRLNCHSSVTYAVNKGGANVTYSDVQAISATNTQHVYNVIVPSEQTIIDRRVEWSATVQFRLLFTGLPAGNGSPSSSTPPYDLVQYGLSSALAPFPLHSCANVISATINNNTVTQNQDDVQQAIIRFLDREHIHRYSGTTPTMPDNYLFYEDGGNNINNVLGSYNNAEKSEDYPARGAFPLLCLNQTGYSATPAFNSVYTGAGGSATLYVSFNVTEPFMLSPFIYGHERHNDQGFYGIQNLNFRMNMTPNARVWRQAVVTNQASVSTDIPLPTVMIDNYIGAKLTFCYLTPHPEDLLPAKNSVGYMELPRYITAGPADIAGLSISGQLNTQTLQLNQVPDKLIVMVRRKNLTVNDTDSFLPITSISVNWNNASGLLASATQQKLWLMSVEAGINQSWLEWSGGAHKYTASVSGGVPISPYPLQVTPLVGGILALDFSRDIQLTESYFSPGSLGTFQLQLRMTVLNQDSATLSASNYDIIVITMNSGVLVCERGTTSVFTGILTKQDVLDASSKPAHYRSDVARCVGAGMMDNLKAVVGHALAKDRGEGMSGGGMSGGGMSGGHDGMHAEVGAGVSGGRRRQHKMADRIAH